MHTPPPVQSALSTQVAPGFVPLRQMKLPHLLCGQSLSVLHARPPFTPSRHFNAEHVAPGQSVFDKHVWLLLPPP